MSGSTLTSLFASIDNGLLDTFGTQGVINYQPAYFPVPASLASQPQSGWTLEQWGQPVTINPNDYCTNDTLASDALYGTPNYTWGESGTNAGLSIFNNVLSKTGGFVYSLSDGGAVGESDFFLATPPALNPANDILNHPITVSLDAKISQANINFADFQQALLSYVFATVDIGFTVTFDGGGGLPYGAYTGFVQIDPYVSNSTQPVSYSTGPLDGSTSFIYTKRFATDPGLSQLPSDQDATPDQLTYNLNNYVYNALLISFANFSPAEQATLLNLANWSVGSMYVGLATNDLPATGPNIDGLAAEISATLQLSNINVSTNLSQTYSSSSSIASVPIVDTNPQIAYYDETIGAGGDADGGQYDGPGPYQYEYFYSGYDNISLTAPTGENWAIGGGNGFTTLVANNMDDLLLASSAGSNMVGGPGLDVFQIDAPSAGSQTTDYSISGFHPGDILVIKGSAVGISTVTETFFIGGTLANCIELNASNFDGSGSVENITLTGSNLQEALSLGLVENLSDQSVSISLSGSPQGNSSILMAVSVAAGADWDPVDVTVSSLINNGLIVIDPSTLTIEAGLSGSGEIEISDQSQLILDGSVATSEIVSFQSDRGTLSLLDSSAFGAQLDGLRDGDIIDLTNLKFGSDSSVVLEAGNLLCVSNKAETVSLQLDSMTNFSHETFYVSSDGFDGTDVTEGPSPCFLADTMILTPTGERRVQDLLIGDMIVNRLGQLVRIKWIGRRTYIPPYPDCGDVIPIVIKCGALADNVPSRDLQLSPLHAIFLDDFLVPVGLLVNERLIYQNSDIQKIEYFHIETDVHDVIMAHSVPCETFLDRDSRKMFENEEDFLKRYPRDVSRQPVQYAPLLESGPHLQRLRRKLALRAGIIPTPVQSDIIGFLDHADRQTISGWAYAPANPDWAISVDLLVNGAVIATVVANEHRADLRRALFTQGRHGFSIRLPAPLSAMIRHEISVRPCGTNTVLSGSPIVIDPGVAHDLIKANGLNALIEAAVKSFSEERDILDFAAVLSNASSRLKSHARKARGLSASHPSSRYSEGSGRSILFLDCAWPTTSLDAGSNAITSHLEAFLTLGYEVTFCATSGVPKTDLENAGFADLLAKGVRCRGQDAETGEEVIRSFSKNSPAFIYLHKFSTAIDYISLTKRILPRTKIIYSIADLHHLRIMRQAKVSARPELVRKAQQVKEAEFFAMRAADCIVTHSIYEESYIKLNLPMANVHVIPWHVTIKPPEEPIRINNDIGFIGGESHSPNLDAVKYLGRSIMPRIWEISPGTRCLVAGAGWSGAGTRRMDPRIKFVDHQTDLELFLRTVGLTVAPLRFGAGIKGKVVDSLSCGVPCAMSPIAAEGLALDSALASCVAELDDMAALICGLLRKPEKRAEMGRAGMDFIRRRFSQDRVIEAFRNMIGHDDGFEGRNAKSSPQYEGHTLVEAGPNRS